jgi:hypothetical protein
VRSRDATDKESWHFEKAGVTPGFGFVTLGPGLRRTHRQRFLTANGVTELAQSSHTHVTGVTPVFEVVAVWPRPYWPGRGSEDVSTTSNIEPVTRLRECRSSFDHFGLGAPVTYQLEPLSARIMPYVFSAWRTMRVCFG